MQKWEFEPRTGNNLLYMQNRIGGGHEKTPLRGITLNVLTSWNEIVEIPT